MGEQFAATIQLTGGLDLVSPHVTLQQTPGNCRRMVNFEPSTLAGYRRINGYSKFGDTQPTGSSDTILGTYPYADGIVAVAATGIYFSTDGTTWLQVNRDTYVAQTGTVSVTSVTAGFTKVNGSGTAFTTEFEVDDHCRINGEIRQISSIISDTEMYLESEIDGGVSAGADVYKNGQTDLSAPSATVKARTDQGRAQFAWYASDGEYGSLVISDEASENNLAWLKITGTGGSRVYYYDVLDSDFAAPSKPKYITQFKERVVCANNSDSTGTITWSERLSNQRFDGASASSAQVDSPILAVKGLRDRVIIFTRNSIHQLTDIDGTPAILPISYNVGCASGWTVQEMGGDLIFLSHDGVRTLSTSDQYGDVQFGNVARKIDPIIKNILLNKESLTFSSSVFRLKNQYRIFYSKSTNLSDQNLGIAGTLKVGQTGNFEYQWSQLQAIDVACLESISNTFVDSDDFETHYHGGYDGYIYQHDVGNSFDGSNISAMFEINELDYGDPGRRKTVHYIRIFGEADFDVSELNVTLRYDYADPNTPQPSTYRITDIQGVSVYGEAVYDTSLYQTTADFNKRLLTDGGGYNNRFIFENNSTDAPFSINSLYVDMRVGAQL